MIYSQTNSTKVGGYINRIGDFVGVVIISLIFIAFYTYICYSVGQIWAIPLFGIIHGYRLRIFYEGWRNDLNG